MQQHFPIYLSTYILWFYLYICLPCSSYESSGMAFFIHIDHKVQEFVTGKRPTEKNCSIIGGSAFPNVKIDSQKAKGSWIATQKYHPRWS